MNIRPLSDSKIIDSWQRNASPWVDAVRNGVIESRRLVTDRAIVDAVLACTPGTVIDLGCGEGWLARELHNHAIEVVGVDVVPALVDAARQAGAGDFRVLSYEDIAAGGLDVRADAVVCNFSLLGKESVERLIRAMPRLLQPDGTLIVQTLHPVLACGDAPYIDGWRTGSWVGFSEAFSDPAPWYFRTLESWIEMLGSSGLSLCALREPIDPRTGMPASVIFVAQAAD
jgi:2-polyprenyl-3-methyl-5-hydroxy-6-metoxy-1,4-benzoquinol methylase